MLRSRAFCHAVASVLVGAYSAVPPPASVQKAPAASAASKAKDSDSSDSSDDSSDEEEKKAGKSCPPLSFLCVSVFFVMVFLTAYSLQLNLHR